mgnify:CR=1 FL=1|tara:strand:- start:10703 stop:10921 length:219 start_codon:yes stop_codon:yes gene_type:complete
MQNKLEITNTLINQTIYGKNGARNQIKLIQHQYESWMLLIDSGCVQSDVDDLEELIMDLQMHVSWIKEQYNL